MILFSSLNDSALPAILAGGAVGVMPTDTIYGLVASARDADAVAKLYRLKERERKPGTVIAASAEQLVELGVDEMTIRLLSPLWPAPLSVEVTIGDHLTHIHQGTGHGAFRVVADETVRALLAKTGPLLTTSANMPGMEPAGNLTEAQGYFGGSVDFYVDGGEVRNRPPSTVARLHPGGKLELVRQGSAKIDQKWLIA